ncbi:hypothetical protein [Streptomyces caniscabiei]|uniref:hypothetical protein n=1 Tax=Streptomyces caniscabiei TaxID=2746961 RepID=UPI000A37DBF2|nr:hypothetical protein [Streptomyces caniscabiei]
MLEAKLLRLLPALVLAAGTMICSSGTPAAAAGSSCTGKSDDRSADNWASTETDLCLRASDKGWSYGAITFTCWKGQTIGWDRADCNLSGLASLTETRDGTTRKVYDRPANLKYTYSVNGDSVTYSQSFTFTCTPGATYAFTLSGAHTIQGYDQATRVDIPNRTVADVPCN